MLQGPDQPRLTKKACRRSSDRQGLDRYARLLLPCTASPPLAPCLMMTPGGMNAIIEASWPPNQSSAITQSHWYPELKVRPRCSDDDPHVLRLALLRTEVTQQVKNKDTLTQDVFKTYAVCCYDETYAQPPGRSAWRRQRQRASVL